MTNSCKNIVLIGMPGCGKTTIGKLLAEKLERKFVDIDGLIEKQQGCTINEIFLHGEEHFRNLETGALLALEMEKALVIATGGGVVKRTSNMESLKRNGIIIYIDRSLSDIAGDIDASTRPLVRNGADRLAQLYAERDALYKMFSDIIIKNEGKSMEVVENIINILKNYKRCAHENNGYKRS